MKEIIKCSTIITESGEEIPIELIKNNEVCTVEVDGAQWFANRNLQHATILYTLLCEHITEYMEYL